VSHSVRLFTASSNGHHQRQQGDASARARVHLKMAALAWSSSCMGPGVPPMTAIAGIAWLCGAARTYYEALTGRPLQCDDDMRWAAEIPPPDAPEGDARLAMMRSQLVLGAVSYAASRHGADACLDFTRMTIGRLCETAINYCEALRGAPDGDSPVVDRTIHLDDGT